MSTKGVSELMKVLLRSGSCLH